MSQVKEKSWIPTSDEIEANRRDFIKEYFSDRSGQIFNRPYGAGYWLHGVEFDPEIGWLSVEDDESIDLSAVDHSIAVAKWKLMYRSQKIRAMGVRKFQNDSLNYFSLCQDAARLTFDNACRKWGEGWMEKDWDICMVEEALQWTLLGEIRYG